MPRYSGIGEKAEDLVFTAIVTAGNKGISKSELLSIVVPMDQSTVYRITLKLEKKGLIKIERNGQRTRYIALKTPQTDFALEGFLFSAKFIDRILGTKGLVSFNPPPWDPDFKPSDPEHPDHELYKDYKSYTRYFRTTFQFGSLEHMIFEYVNQIGGYMISVFLTAMDPRNITKFKSTRNDEKNSLAMSYVRNSIGAKLLKILWRFWTIINSWILQNKKSGKKTDDSFDSQKELGLLLEDKTINTVKRAIQRLYPRLIRRLEDLQRISGYDKERFIQSHSYMLQRERERDGCTHPKFIACKSNIVRKRGKNVIKQKCAKCRRWVTSIQPHKELDWTDPYKMADMQ
ncbi:MAG: hypothetical protein WBL67_14335 [Nitrososphaeraceae archaeon]